MRWIKQREDWYSSSGSSGTGIHSVSTQLNPDEPAVLFRRRFTHRDEQGRSNVPDDPSEGILLWIEPVNGADPAA